MSITPSDLNEILLTFFGKTKWDEFSLSPGQKYITSDARVETFVKGVSTDADEPPRFYLGFGRRDPIIVDDIPPEAIGAMLRRLHFMSLVLGKGDPLVCVHGTPEITNTDMSGGMLSLRFSMAAGKG